MKKRNRIIMFLLMGAFRGLYNLYWQFSVQQDIQRRNPKELAPGLTLFLTIVTFGIYYLVWQWKTCLFLKNNGQCDRRVSCFVFSILMIGLIINPLLIQGDINRLLKSTVCF